MTRLNHEKVNRNAKVQGANPANPPTKKNSPGIGSDWVKIVSKFSNTCLICSQKVKENSKIYWSKSTRQVVHSGCMSNMLRQGVNPTTLSKKLKNEKPKLDKKGKSPFIASPVVRGWKDIV